MAAMTEDVLFDDLDVVALHRRRMVGRRGKPIRDTIDHLVVGPSGVWVVDAKAHYGPVEIRRLGGTLRPRDEQLFINGRNRNSLVEGLQRQVATVRSELLRAGHDANVRGALCFVGTALPWVTEQFDGVPLVAPPALRELVARAGELDRASRAELASVLAERFASA